jgi:hypothetical protein
MKTELTADRLRALLAYDEISGQFTWNPGRRRVKDGATAGSKSPKLGYIFIRIDQRSYSAHRLVWLYVHGDWPKHQIDHINGQRDDNRIVNLRDVTVAVNLQNRRGPCRNSTTGELGVTNNRGRNCFTAALSLNGKYIYLGDFKTIPEAKVAYLEGKRRLHVGNTL